MQIVPLDVCVRHMLSFAQQRNKLFFYPKHKQNLFPTNGDKYRNDKIAVYYRRRLR